MKPFRWFGILTILTLLFLLAGCGDGGGGGGSPPGTGTGSFVLNAARTELTFDITVTGLSGAITAAHFHNAAAGLDGPIVRTITSSFSNTASGVWKLTDSEPLTPALVAEIEAGRIYVNIHTAANPAGEIRGHLAPVSAGNKGFMAEMEGDHEAPPVITSASGTGAFVLNAARTELTFDITVNGLSGPITSAHFHNAAEGVNGQIVRAITSSYSANTASGVWKNTDSEPLTLALVDELDAGRIYVNVHTSANSGGEIRGQVIANQGTSFIAKFGSGLQGGGGGSGY